MFAKVVGYSEYAAHEKIHNGGTKTFLGLNKHAAVPGFRSEMGWMEPRSRSQVKMIRMLHRLISMPDNRITKKVFLWDKSLSENPTFQTWSGEVKSILARNNLETTFGLNIFNLSSTIEQLKNSLFSKDLIKLNDLCLGMPKLRTYNKISGTMGPKPYLMKPLSFPQRRSLARIRLGTLPLRIETGRYERPKKAAEERICDHCALNKVETEAHFLLECPKHHMMRSALFRNILCNDFYTMDETDKLKYLLTNQDIVKSTSQFIKATFDNRFAHQQPHN